MQSLISYMKWANHQIIGFSVPLILSGSLPLSIASAVFSVAPDAIEGSRDKKLLKHRGLSHNPFVWLAICAAGLLLIHILKPHIMSNTYLNSVNFYKTVLWADLSLAVGVSLHLLADSLTITGIPLLGSRRAALKLFHTGSFVEYLISYGLFAAALLLRFRGLFPARL